MAVILYWFILLIFIHLSLYPSIKKILPSVAVPVSLTSGFILLALTSWYAAYAGLSPFFGLIPFLLALIITQYFKWYGWYREIPYEWHYYVLFLFVFIAFLVIRLFSPDINGAEKFMDHAFLASIIRNPIIPPLDPWFAGGELNVYYYFGHWMMAIPALLTGTPSYIVFNLALPTVAAISALNLYGVGNLVLKRLKLLPVLAFFVINPYFIYLALTGTGSFSLLWDSSRVIQSTINEYPLFSFLFGDVHAHVLGILPQSFLILLLTLTITCWRSITGLTRMMIILLSALGLSIIPAVNSWDVLIWAPMVLALGICLCLSGNSNYPLVKKPEIFIQYIRKMLSEKGISWLEPEPASLIYLVFVPLISLLIISPLLLGMYTQGIEGIGFVHSPSHIYEFLMVHGWFFLAFFLSFRSRLVKIPWIIFALIPFFLTDYLSAALTCIFLFLVLYRRDGASDLLAAGGLFILLFCELFYLADNMGEVYYRMNTVFKLYIGAWLLCGTSAALMIGKEADTYIQNNPGWKERFINWGIIATLCLCLIIPSLAVSTIHGPHTPTLDGMAWLSSSHPSDAEAIAFLRTLPGDHILVEATGDDYQYSSRVSSFTGIPTVIGWQFHEYMWRGNNPEGWYSKRDADVRTMYEDPLQTIPLMNAYNADLLYVGLEEHEKYQVLIPYEFLEIIYQNRDVTIFHNNQSGLVQPI
ncbi:MAG: hypothetical protein GXY48_01185 [Methanomicrobiales archaeon]|nr:hypothetical protein [Methanomicrobiales archaeon]